jgi:hypothetical protein
MMARHRSGDVQACPYLILLGGGRFSADLEGVVFANTIQCKA